MASFIQNNSADLRKRLVYYTDCLAKDYSTLNQAQRSFIKVSRASIINVMGKLQCESYLKYNIFNKTELRLIRSICCLSYFTQDDQVNHILGLLKKAFKRGQLKEAMLLIQYMKNLQLCNQSHFTTLYNQLFDILEHITCITLNNHLKGMEFSHWICIFDILFRGTTIKLSIEGNQLSFYCLSQNTVREQQRIELSACTFSSSENDQEQAVLQSEWISAHQTILVALFQEVQSVGSFFPIGIHIKEYDGYLFSLRLHGNVYVASKVSDCSLFIPQNEQEYQWFLESRVLDTLCHLKRHYIELAKVIRRTAIQENMWMIHDVQF